MGMEGSTKSQPLSEEGQRNDLLESYTPEGGNPLQIFVDPKGKKEDTKNNQHKIFRFPCLTNPMKYQNQ